MSDGDHRVLAHLGLPAHRVALLAEAGFARPDCFWKHGPMTVFGGYR